jgi:hypothetical protein
MNIRYKAIKSQHAVQQLLPFGEVRWDFYYNPLSRLIQTDFPDAWNQMSSMSMNVAFKTEHLPFFLRENPESVAINEINLVFSTKETIAPDNKKIMFNALELPLNTTIQQNGDAYIYSAGIKIQSNYPVCVGSWVVDFSNSGITDIDQTYDVICSFGLIKE